MVSITDEVDRTQSVLVDLWSGAELLVTHLDEAQALSLEHAEGAFDGRVVAFGDPVPTASFTHHHVYISQNWAQLWSQNGGVSHEYFDGTWVDGGGRAEAQWGRARNTP